MPERALPGIGYAKDLDRQLAEPDHARALRPTMFEWSKKVRWALGLAAADLGKKLGISQQAVTKLEINESSGAISLERLAAIANALDCELVYGFIPRRPFTETARDNDALLDAARAAHRKMPRL